MKDFNVKKTFTIFSLNHFPENTLRNKNIIISAVLIFYISFFILAGCAEHPAAERLEPVKTEQEKTLSRPRLRECPDVMIINRMPESKGPSVYYLVKGQRREISDMDTEWLWENCKIREQIVY